MDNNSTHKVKINWLPLNGAFRISHYIVKTSDNRIFNVSTDSDSIDIGDFVREDIEYSATVTGVDIAGNIGEESDPVFFILDSEYFQYTCIQTNYYLHLILHTNNQSNNCHMQSNILSYCFQNHLTVPSLLLSNMSWMMVTFTQSFLGKYVNI